VLHTDDCYCAHYTVYINTSGTPNGREKYTETHFGRKAMKLLEKYGRKAMKLLEKYGSALSTCRILKHKQNFLPCNLIVFNILTVPLTMNSRYSKS